MQLVYCNRTLHTYDEILSFQFDKFRSCDIMLFKDGFVFSTTNRIQPHTNLVYIPIRYWLLFQNIYQLKQKNTIFPLAILLLSERNNQINVPQSIFLEYIQRIRTVMKWSYKNFFYIFHWEFYQCEISNWLNSLNGSNKQTS